MLERRKPYLGKRTDIASDEVTGKQAAGFLSNVLGYKIKYVPVPLDQVYQANEHVVRIYEWYEKVGTRVDTSLHQEYSEANCFTFKNWTLSKLG